MMPSSLKIVKYPHPALRQKAQPVQAITDEVRRVAARMFELMYEHEGLGLAAPQVALPWQLIVLNFTADPDKRDNELVAINPVIVESKGSVVGREGCLSFPGLYQNVRRAKTVKVQAYDLQGRLYEMVCHDLPARVWQHEIDHLHGILFIDRMGSLGRERSARELQQFIAEFEADKKKGLISADLVAQL
ncbi:MAG: peptide deformylase [Gemmataceae bacterium]|nr:peptide deformylase [Gemmataceae bacterium]MCS7271233.1 peptide deformylase [Gemmataceae bacterium]MDW8241887.1 peptide deformylase [Thermogemmata sp.]